MTSQDLQSYIIDFFNYASRPSNDINIYNEFSLQHELGIYLRDHIACRGYHVQFERNVSFFRHEKKNTASHLPIDWVKKEIDITIFNSQEKFAIELKFPRNKAYPRRMFQFIEDICFIEQLKQSGFDGGCAVTLITDNKFCQGSTPSNIYKYFRITNGGTQPITGAVNNPINSTKKNTIKTLHVNGTYLIKWKSVTIIDKTHYNGSSSSLNGQYYVIPIS